MSFSYSQVSPNQVRVRLEQAQPVLIVDVREPWEYARRHIPQALLMPMDEFAGRCRTELAPEGEIVVVCEHGVRSESAAHYLSSLGYERVSTMTGGMACYDGKTEK